MPMGEVMRSGAASTAVDPTDVPTAKTSIWDDPNLLAIMLGTMGQAIMGRHQQTWQAQLGKGAVGLGQSFKMAQLAARRQEEEREFWKAITGAISGEAPPEAAGTELEGGFGSQLGGYKMLPGYEPPPTAPTPGAAPPSPMKREYRDPYSFMY